MGVSASDRIGTASCIEIPALPEAGATTRVNVATALGGFRGMGGYAKEQLWDIIPLQSQAVQEVGHITVRYGEGTRSTYTLGTVEVVYENSSWRLCPHAKTIQVLMRNDEVLECPEQRDERAVVFLSKM